MVAEEAKVDAAMKKTGTMFSKVWPCFLNAGFSPMQYPAVWFSINIMFISQLFWPGDPFHPFEMGIAFGLMHIVGAFSKLLFGRLADTRSRIKLLAITSFFPSLGFFFFGFVPEGGGIAAYIVFIIFIAFRESFTAETPVEVSYTDDAIGEKQRSQVFGAVNALGAIVMVVAMIISALVFSTGWRYYFWIAGIIGMASGIVISIFGKEPKRGAEKAELKSILRFNAAVYKYDLTKETIKATVLSTTNLVALIEGIFTYMMAMVPIFLMFAYLQSAPYFLSPFSVSLIYILFALPGNITGNMLLAKKSDELGNRTIKNRIRLIFGSLIGCALACFLVMIPLPPLLNGEGASIGAILSIPAFWVPCIAMFFGYVLMGVYQINQRPLLQKINLPEAQGIINAVNLFLEILSAGIGAVLAGFLLSILGNNYQLVALVLCLIGVGGTMLWLIGLKRVDGDLARVSGILKQRASQIEQNQAKP
jgi:MFS family permease